METKRRYRHLQLIVFVLAGLTLNMTGCTNLRVSLFESESYQETEAGAVIVHTNGTQFVTNDDGIWLRKDAVNKLHPAVAKAMK